MARKMVSGGFFVKLPESGGSCGCRRRKTLRMRAGAVRAEGVALECTAEDTERTLQEAAEHSCGVLF